MIVKSRLSADVEIDDGRLSISTSAPSSFYEKKYGGHTKKKRAQKMGKKKFYRK